MFFPDAALVDCMRSDKAEATSLTALMSMTCASRFGAPRLVAPAFTTSLSWTIVVTAFCAATASCSCDEAAPATRVLVSSTKALAVFKMFSRWSVQKDAKKFKAIFIQKFQWFGITMAKSKLHFPWYKIVFRWLQNYQQMLHQFHQDSEFLQLQRGWLCPNLQ